MPESLALLNDFKDFSQDQVGIIQQLIVAPLQNASAQLKRSCLPAEIPSEELYAIWVKALETLSFHNFLLQEYRNGRLFR